MEASATPRQSSETADQHVTGAPRHGSLIPAKAAWFTFMGFTPQQLANMGFAEIAAAMGATPAEMAKAIDAAAADEIGDAP